MSLQIMSRKRTLLSFLLWFLLLVDADDGLPNRVTHKLCIDQDNRDACQQIGRDNIITCQPVASKVDCILSADTGNAVLSVLSPEEAVLGAALATQQTVVIAEIAQANYETVVLVSSGFQGGFKSTGLRYCHPGYDHSELITKYVVEELDRQAITYSCNNNITLLEQKFEALSRHFGASCRPGKWAEDENFDAELKSKYASLCNLCGTSGCNVRYTEPFRDSLTCLTQSDGALALTTARHATEFLSNAINAQRFQYLCLNGSVSASQCVWTSQTRRVFISSSASASQMTAYLRNQLPAYVQDSSDSASDTVQQSLARVLPLSSDDRITIISPIPLSQYVSGRRQIPSVSDSIQCNYTVRWSVTNDDELNKCQWLQQAAVNVGLQPVITCNKSSENDTVSNMQNIQNNVADIAFVDANYGYRARRKNLTQIAYLETDRRQLSRIVIIVRNDTSWFNGNFENLRGRGACLPEYGGKEWLTLIDTLIQKRILSTTCDYGGALSGFVGNSCAPGAREAETDIPNTNTDLFCATCIPTLPVLTASYCNADYRNKYFGSEGALQCLADGAGEYAVISLNDLPDTYSINPQYRGVARDGSIINVNDFYTSNDAPLAIITAGEILIRRDNPKFQDIVQLLRSIEKEFGQNLDKAFKVFEKFNNIPDLLFPDSTPGITISGGGNAFIARYQELLKNSELCSRGQTPSGGIPIVPSLTIIIIFIFARMF